MIVTPTLIPISFPFLFHGEARRKSGIRKGNGVIIGVCMYVWIDEELRWS